jgi:hypothetical protein
VDVLSILELGTIRQRWLVAPSLGVLFRPADMFAFLDVMFLAAIRLLTVTWHLEAKHRPGARRVMIGALAVAVVCSAFVLRVVHDDRDQVSPELLIRVAASLRAH